MSAYGHGRLLPGDLGYRDAQYDVDRAAEMERGAEALARERFEGPFTAAGEPSERDHAAARRAILLRPVAGIIADARANQGENELSICFRAAERILALVDGETSSLKSSDRQVA